LEFPALSSNTDGGNRGAGVRAGVHPNIAVTTSVTSRLSGSAQPFVFSDAEPVDGVVANGVGSVGAGAHPDAAAPAATGAGVHPIITAPTTVASQLSTSAQPFGFIAAEPVDAIVADGRPTTVAGN
jgi:hypothetical protein